jgi:hypothetical protein
MQLYTIDVVFSEAERRHGDRIDADLVSRRGRLRPVDEIQIATDEPQPPLGFLLPEIALKPTVKAVTSDMPSIAPSKPRGTPPKRI